MSRNNSHLDYFMMYTNLVNLLGERNVCFLPIEMISEISFWKSLVDFTGLTSSANDLLTESQLGRQNVRSTKANFWKLQSFKVKKKAQADTMKDLNLLLPRLKEGGKIYTVVENILLTNYNSFVGLSDDHRDFNYEIVLTSSLKDFFWKNTQKIIKGFQTL